MALTALKVLENTEYNLSSNFLFQKELGTVQLKNAIKQLNDNLNTNSNFNKKYFK